ncbi:NHL repeat containing protein [Desulfurobacterium thermolithotrophum DSM 11699]|uniref:NHL repeat containing protein n=1 Tax=Desulfurobacterium thermolithotrophum (strain DSM 11699 / BSA) TaxID=868864 RepID=F0S2B1_DESTD|nr:ATP/GTP-binding protein [Desulfurobacterium thermolithotrophum]ADY74126.1 NHL repeat containing protein [Desulfurobacterium thermolithotrophum DSM 11699]
MGITAGIVAAFTLILLFNLNQGLKYPESSQCYKGKLYISNIGNPLPDKKDGNGYITLADLKGNILKRELISGLNAPKGISFADGKLFVADIDTVVVANPQNGKILKKIKIPQARFLYDTAYDGKGHVYVSDTQTNTIYRIDTKTYKVSLFIKSSELQGPKGIAFTRSGKMIVASWGGGKIIQIEHNKFKTLTTGLVNPNGVIVLDDNTILISDFSAGAIYKLKNGRIERLTLSSAPADIGYCKDKLFIPEPFLNNVKVFELKR